MKRALDLVAELKILGHAHLPVALTASHVRLVSSLPISQQARMGKKVQMSHFGEMQSVKLERCLASQSVRACGREGAHSQTNVSDQSFSNRRAGQPQQPGGLAVSLVQTKGRAARLLKNIIWEAPRSVSPLTL